MIGWNHLAFLCVDGELECFQESFDFGFYPLPLFRTFNADDEVISVTGEAVAFAFKITVKVIKYDVGESWGQWSALWHTTLGRLYVAIDADACTQVFTNQLKHSFVINPF